MKLSIFTLNKIFSKWVFFQKYIRASWNNFCLRKKTELSMTFAEFFVHLPKKVNNLYEVLQDNFEGKNVWNCSAEKQQKKWLRKAPAYSVAMLTWLIAKTLFACISTLINGTSETTVSSMYLHFAVWSMRHLHYQSGENLDVLDVCVERSFLLICPKTCSCLQRSRESESEDVPQTLQFEKVLQKNETFFKVNR